MNKRKNSNKKCLPVIMLFIMLSITIIALNCTICYCDTDTGTDTDEVYDGSENYVSFDDLYGFETDSVIDTDTEVIILSDIDTRDSDNPQSDTDTGKETDTSGSDNTDSDKPSYLLGDVDLNGFVNMLDVVELQRAVAKLVTLNDIQCINADVNRDKVQNMQDVVLIQKFIAKLITNFDSVNPETESDTEKSENKTEMLLKIDANGTIFYAEFENNSSAEAFKKILAEKSITIHMIDYGGFEKVGDLPFELPKNDKSITTEPGDVILYQGNKLTIYYDTNTWSFTKIAKIRNVDGSLRNLLGEGDITVTLSLV
ncbi:MAG: hypothetical protein K6F76_06590 [Clostridiales bacterium]|nr:hypothetical protein [Clostridiales bacterium]